MVAEAGSSGPPSEATELAMEHWSTYFQGLAGAAGVRVSVEILGGSAPARPPLQARGLRAIGYAEGEDALRIEADAGLRHRWPVRYFITNPRTIHVAESDHVAEIVVRDKAGVGTLIRLFLPADA